MLTRCVNHHFLFLLRRFDNCGFWFNHSRFLFRRFDNLCGFRFNHSLFLFWLRDNRFFIHRFNHRAFLFRLHDNRFFIHRFNCHGFLFRRFRFNHHGFLFLLRFWLRLNLFMHMVFLFVFFYRRSNHDRSWFVFYHNDLFFGFMRHLFHYRFYTRPLMHSNGRLFR